MVYQTTTDLKHTCAYFNEEITHDEMELIGIQRVSSTLWHRCVSQHVHCKCTS